ncbi:MAG: 23S rRNA (guanosine(2251)-2'-O)-methyltransferase RlmB, partial [Bacilli bacterium]
SGKNPVIEALKSERTVHKLLVSDSINKGSIGGVLSLANAKKVVVQFVPKKKLDQLSDGKNHQGLVAQVAAYDYAEMEDLFAAAEKKGEAPFFIILDEIEDPHNLGSILRTADATGVHGVIIPKRRAVGLTSTVAKTSAGAIEYVPVVRVTNIVQTIEKLKEQGVWITGTDASGQELYQGIDFTIPTAFVIGSEGRGMSRLVKEKCDFVVKLPMVGQITSLNASVAASLCMYEVLRKRLGK